jgi:hypothetical protein
VRCLCATSKGSYAELFPPLNPHALTGPYPTQLPKSLDGGADRFNALGCLRHAGNDAQEKDMMMGYCSVSIFEPAARLEFQRRELAVAGASGFFCEKTATLSKAPELERAIDFAQKGDVIVVTKPYRIAYSRRGVLAIIDRLGRKGAGLRILNTPIDTSTTTGRMILGSVPSWSLGMSPLRSMLWDLSFGWWQTR